MEIRPEFSFGLLETFLLISSLISLSLASHPANEVSNSFPLLPTRLLTTRQYASSSSATIQQFLIPHNVVRAKLGLPPLKWSKKLANFASWWAHQRQGDCALIHSNSNYGENIFWGSCKDWKPGHAVAAWAAEKSYYNYNSNACTQNKDCLHHTQMVWRQSLKLGCAKVVCAGGDTFLTCNYDPHGNVVGQKPF